MAVIVFNPPSGGLLPTPPPSKRLQCSPTHSSGGLLPTPCSFSASRGFGGGRYYNRESCSRKSSGINSATPRSSNSPSPPRQNHEKKQKTTTTTTTATTETESKKVYYSGASFFVPSPAPDSLPVPSFLAGGQHTPAPATVEEQEAHTTTNTASDVRRRRQYSREFLLSLSRSSPADCPPIHYQLDLSGLLN